MMGNVQAPSTQRSVRYGLHWAVCRQVDRVGQAIEKGRKITDHVHYLKSMCYPLWRDDEEFQNLWEGVKEEIKNIEDLSEKQKYTKLRREQLNLLMGLLWDNEVLVDKGMSVESIELLERRS